MAERPRPTGRRRVALWTTALLVIGLCLAPLTYCEIRKDLLKSGATAELDRLRLPTEWVSRGRPHDQYVAPQFGLTAYSSITRDFVVPDQPGVVREAVNRAAAQAGWTIDRDYPYSSKAPSCEYNDGCWSKDKYRLFLDADNYANPETKPEYRQYTTCPNPPYPTCTRFNLEITWASS